MTEIVPSSLLLPSVRQTDSLIDKSIGAPPSNTLLCYQSCACPSTSTQPIVRRSSPARFTLPPSPGLGTQSPPESWNRPPSELATRKCSLTPPTFAHLQVDPSSMGSIGRSQAACGVRLGGVSRRAYHHDLEAESVPQRHGRKWMSHD